MKELLAATLFGIFCFVSLFGLPALLSQPDHHVGCPLHAASAAICERSTIEHFSMWQSMFVSVVHALTLLSGIAVFVFALFDASFAEERVRIRLCARDRIRPTLMQELFSRGILNRKEPYVFS
jgi:hypothetical protein